MLLGPVFERFVAKSPLSVMARGLMEYALNPERLDQLFDDTADKQYTRELLFSSVVDLMSLVVCGARPSIRAAYRALEDRLPVSLTSVYNKLDGLEPNVAATLVRHTASQLDPVIRQLGGERSSWLPPGYRLKILDGNHLTATEHRLAETRTSAAAPLPGMSLVVLDPVLMLAIDVFPCEDGHAQERSLFADVLATVAERDVWLDDRNFCTLGFLFGVAERGAYFITRQHKGLPWEGLSEFRRVGDVEGGEVWEQTVRLTNDDGRTLRARRIKVVLEQPTRDGETELFILTNLPAAEVGALAVARIYRKRWTIETMFQELALTLETEIDTLCYPRAALFGFCVGLVAYNILAGVKGSLRAVHGEEKIEKELSSYYVADEVGGTYRGMMIAIPEEEWGIFRGLGVLEVAEVLRSLAGRVRLERFKKATRGPKKPQPKRRYNKKQPHISTARVLEKRRKRKP
jgi:hypothetical protein